MITNLQKIWTRLSIINNIPKKFFSKLEESNAFNENLFPEWANLVYQRTTLKEKFRAVYDKYKLLGSENTRNKVISSFSHSLQIEKLCNNEHGTQIIKVKDLPKSIQSEIEVLFEYLYNTALNYHEFVRFLFAHFVDWKGF